MSAETAGWFYTFNDERKGPFSREQVSALLSAGVITEHTKVWSEALSEWTPLFRTELRTLLGERAIVPPAIEPTVTDPAQSRHAPAAQPAAARTSYPMYDNRTLGMVVRWASLLCAGFSVLPIIQIVRKKTVQEQYAVFRAYESEQALMIMAAILLGTFALFMTWKYRATANLFNAGGPQTVTPAGAVYWYFVPVLWFWKPYEAMRNLWNGFGVDNKHAYLLGAWWFSWWAGAGIAVLSGIVLPEEIKLVSEARAYVYWNVAISAFDGMAFFFAHDIVKRICAKESLHATALRAA